MTIPTLADLQERLNLYRDAERAILQGHQSYSVGDKQFNRANINWIQSQIRLLEQQISAHPDNTVGGGRLSHSTAVFGGRR